MASPWGRISGKLGRTVGVVRKGRQYIRIWVKPKDPKTNKQIHMREPIMGVLGYIARTNLSSFIWPIWEKICKKRRLAMTGTNLFVKINVRRLQNSIPEQDKASGPDNLPDYTKMCVSMGNLEPCFRINSAFYDKKTGKITIKWHEKAYGNGAPDDEVYVGVYQKPEKKRPYGEFSILEVDGKREDGSITVDFSGSKDPLLHTGLYVYLFFYNKKIGYSPSIGKSAE